MARHNAVVWIVVGTICHPARGDNPAAATTDSGPVLAIKTTTPEEAAYLALSPLSSTNTVELRPAYTWIRRKGNLWTVDGRVGLWMPYVLVPGAQASNMGSIVIMDVSFERLHLPTS